MKTIDDALELRRRIFGAFEKAELTADPAEQRRWLTIAIVGAGPTGVELAGQVRELAMRSLRGEFRTFDPASARVVLLDGGERPLATFGKDLLAKRSRSSSVSAWNSAWGPEWSGSMPAGSTSRSSDGITSRLEAYTTVWAARSGSTPLASALAEAYGAELDRSGRIAVLDDLTLRGHPEVFVVGDMMSLRNLPGVAEVAMQGGLYAANTIVRRLQGKASRPFKYRDLGSAATIGRFRSVVDFRGLRLSGFPGWVVWGFVHLTFLTGFGNRVTTLLTWTRSSHRPRPGRTRVQCDAHGWHLSLPADVRAIVQPKPLPRVQPETRLE